jgi:hypothetical protein
VLKNPQNMTPKSTPPAMYNRIEPPAIRAAVNSTNPSNPQAYETTLILLYHQKIVFMSLIC